MHILLTSRHVCPDGVGSTNTRQTEFFYRSLGSSIGNFFVHRASYRTTSNPSQVFWAASQKIPFVCESGGTSLYSTIGSPGFVIDLEGMSAVDHNKERHEATSTSAISGKAVATALAADGFCATFPSANPVGAIPFFHNGGNSPLISKLGYAFDSILAAHMVTASGTSISISDLEHTDLLFGNSEGSFWSGRIIFPLDRAQDVADAMTSIIEEPDHFTGGLLMVTTVGLPAEGMPAIAVLPRLIGRACQELHSLAFKALYDLHPLASGGGMVRVENNGDALQALCAHGDFKKLRLTAILAYRRSFLPDLAQLWQGMIGHCPHARNSYFGIQWESQPPLAARSDSANGLHGIRLWANNMTWCTQGENTGYVQQYLESTIAITRHDQDPQEHVDFASSVRKPESPVQYRYRDWERLKRLRHLKQQRDAEGVFSQELL